MGTWSKLESDWMIGLNEVRRDVGGVLICMAMGGFFFFFFSQTCRPGW